MSQPRKPARALRFAEIKVGDQLMVRYATKFQQGDGKGGWIDKTDPLKVWYYVVTDLFFDPVAGEHDDLAGRMVAIKRLDPRTGKPCQAKRSHTLRGLASNGYHYADIDFITQRALAIEATNEGRVINIAMGKIIRKRPNPLL